MAAKRRNKADRDARKAGRRQPSRTGLLEFAARAEFRYRPNNASPRAEQTGAGGGRFLTSAQNFANQVLVRSPQQFHIRDTAVEIDCVARTRWAATHYRNRKVLFLLPSQALGNNVCILLFLQAFIEQHRPKEVGVFCAQSASDIYLRAGNVTVHALWLARTELRRWDMVIDLGHLESRRNIEFWPVDMEADLLEAFELAPSETYAGTARTIETDIPRIGLFPLASSPLRTLPVAATLALVAEFESRGDVTLCLNRHQRQGQLYAKAIASKLPDSVQVIDAFASIGDLLDQVAACDYIVAADSGPAHMAKLSATPGLAAYTSAPGEILQGRFSNLARWTVPYEGANCRAPCGLAGVRQTTDGRIGCMGSLAVTAEELPEAPRRQQADAVDRLFEAPVPCIRYLGENPGSLVAAVREDFEKRQA